MGFNAGLYCYPKLKDGMSVRDYSYITTYLSYDKNDWAKKNFKTAIEYAQYAYGSKSSDTVKYLEPTMDECDYFYPMLKQNEYGSWGLDKEYGYWCSNGSEDIFEWFQELANEKNKQNHNDYSLSVELSKEDVAKFASFCWEHISKNLPQPCTINRAFNYIPREDGDDEDYYDDIRLTRCDGIEVTFEDGTNKRFDTNCEDDYVFSMPREYYDEWSMSGYIIGLESALAILSEVDFNKQVVFYNGGW